MELSYCDFNVTPAGDKYKHRCVNCSREILSRKPKVVAMCLVVKPVRQCRHLGEQTGETPCLPCQGNKQIPLHACAVHGKCTPGGSSHEIQDCASCPNFSPMPANARIVVLGYPGDMGGAGTELWHTLRLWRSRGWPVTLIPTWGRDKRWVQKTASIGAETVFTSKDKLEDVEILPGSVVVSFCNDQFLDVAPRLRAMGCKLVFVNCMTWLFNAEREFYVTHGTFDAYMFQSMYQQTMLAPQLVKYGADPSRFHLIHGAFDPVEFPYSFKELKKDEPYYIGRISRPDSDKWSPNLWNIYENVRHPDRRARVMAWTQKLTDRIGEPPSWAEPLGPAKETAQAFLSSLHCMLPVNGSARENWSRALLESFALGVPVVAQNSWGLAEMIVHGHTGFLANSEEELSGYATVLAHDEVLREQMARNAREHLVTELANPERIAEGWLWLWRYLDLPLT